MVTTRLRNTIFKRVLNSIPLDAQVKMQSPFGNLTLHNNVSRPAVFLAGGIGITPFSQHAATCSEAEATASHFLLLLEPTAGRCTTSRRVAGIPAAGHNMTEMEKSHRRWKGGSRTTIYQMLDRYLRQWHPQNGTAQGRSTISPDRHRWFAIFKPCSSIPVSIAATFVSKCLLVSEPVTGPKKFPFHMWTPDVYERAPAPITAFGATVSKGASHDRRRFYDHAAVAGRDSAYSRVR